MPFHLRTYQRTASKLDVVWMSPLPEKNGYRIPYVKTYKQCGEYSRAETCPG
jgi:hypothetical protein